MCATRLLNAGMDITGIQKLLGHEMISTTMIYAKVQNAAVEVAIARHSVAPNASKPRSRTDQLRWMISQLKLLKYEKPLTTQYNIARRVE